VCDWRKQAINSDCNLKHKQSLSSHSRPSRSGWHFNRLSESIAANICNDRFLTQVFSFRLTLKAIQVYLMFTISEESEIFYCIAMQFVQLTLHSFRPSTVGVSVATIDQCISHVI